MEHPLGTDAREPGFPWVRNESLVELLPAPPPTSTPAPPEDSSNESLSIGVAVVVVIAVLIGAVWACRKWKRSACPAPRRTRNNGTDNKRGCCDRFLKSPSGGIEETDESTQNDNRKSRIDALRDIFCRCGHKAHPKPGPTPSPIFTPRVPLPKPGQRKERLFLTPEDGQVDLDEYTTSLGRRHRARQLLPPLAADNGEEEGCPFHPDSNCGCPTAYTTPRVLEDKMRRQRELYHNRPRDKDRGGDVVFADVEHHSVSWHRAASELNGQQPNAFHPEDDANADNPSAPLLKGASSSGSGAVPDVVTSAKPPTEGSSAGQHPPGARSSGDRFPAGSGARR